MKIVIAPDSYKGSVSAADAADAIEKGIRRYLPQAEIVKVPVADGGEGTLDSLIAAAGGERVPFTVHGPLGRAVQAQYGLLHQGDEAVAVIEMASATGLTLISSEERDPLKASTYGTGELIKKALDDGCRRFLLALGGSATNDGGAGMLQALGLKLLDAEGTPLADGIGGGELHRIATIDDSGWDSRVAEASFLIATDVQNPFVGPSGASHVFGPQKGASPDQVEQLDRNLHAWADRIEAHTRISLHDKPGAGAAGGIGGAFLAFFPTSIRRGIDVVIEYAKLAERLQGADLVITGEGQIDFQTASGKTPMGVAQEAQKLGIPAFALAGSVGKGIEALYEVGIQSVRSIVNGPMTLQEAMERAPELLEQAAEQLMRTFVVPRDSKA